MPIKTIEQAREAIRERKHVARGKKYSVYDVYIGVNSITQEPIRLYANTRQAVLKKIDSFYASRKKEGGDLVGMLTAKQLIDARMAYYELEESKTGLTLLECVRGEISRARELLVHDHTVGDCYREFLSGKPDGADKDKTVSTTGKFVARTGEDRMVATITTQEIESYLKTHYEAKAVTTYNSHFSYLFTFFNWCAHAKRRYIAENPMAVLDKKVEAWKDPKYLSPADTLKLFRALEEERDAYPDLLAHAVTNFFTGTRRAEILRMSEMDDAAKIHVDDETIRISKGKGYTRGRAPRTAHIMPNALAWMKSFDFASALKMVDDNTTDRLFRLAERHGIRLFRNCGRHTFITMHVAAFGDPSKTQAMVGTSAKMRAEHYDGLASKKEGEAYFAIYPSGASAEGGQSVRSPSAAS